MLSLIHVCQIRTDGTTTDASRSIVNNIRRKFNAVIFGLRLPDYFMMLIAGLSPPTGHC